MFYTASGYVLSKRLVCRQTVGYACYFYPLLRSSLFSDVTRVNQRLPTFRDILSVPSSRVLSCRRFGTAYRTRYSNLLFNISVRHTYSVYKEKYHNFFHIRKTSKYSSCLHRASTVSKNVFIIPTDAQNYKITRMLKQLKYPQCLPLPCTARSYTGCYAAMTLTT